jgi:hypothetical protein
LLPSKMITGLLGSVVLVLLGACSANPTPIPAPAANSIVRPLSDILVGGPQFADAGPNSITLQIETRLPVVCAVSYGTTTAYGQLATSTDMGGGGITKHHPILMGMQPDTLYQIRLQGIGPDGTIYVGDNFTYRTPSAPANLQPVQPAGKDVALASAGAHVKAVSSNYGGGDVNSPYGANKAIDGDFNTEWSSNGDGDKAWIEIDLGQAYAITSLGFRTRTMGTSAQIERFQVVTDKGETLGPFDLPDAKSVYYFPISTTARTIRFEVLKSSGGNTGAAEIQVYAAP